MNITPSEEQLAAIEANEAACYACGGPAACLGGEAPHSFCCNECCGHGGSGEERCSLLEEILEADEADQ